MDELMQVEMLKNNLALFDDEFNNLKNFYIVDSEREIYDFIKIHPGILLLLNEFEPHLKKYFPNEYFELKFCPDVSGTWFDLLELNIWMDQETFNNGSNEYVKKIRREFLPLRRKLDLLGELLIFKRVLR